MKHRQSLTNKTIISSVLALALLAAIARTSPGRYVLDEILMTAIERDHKSAIAPLILLGADPNCHIDEDLTPIIFLMTERCDKLPLKDKFEMASVLQKHGANVDAGGLFRNMPPLSAAALQDNIPFTGWLLDHGANINARDTENYDTPLQQAVEEKHVAMCQFLLAHGADTEIADCIGATPLMKTHSPAIAALLLHAPSHTTKNDHEKILEMTLLTQARFGSAAIVRLLLAAGVNVNAVTPYGSALMGATTRRRSAVVKTLLDYGADTSGRDNRGRTALEYASRNRDTAIVKLLIEAGAHNNRHVKAIREIACGKIMIYCHSDHRHRQGNPHGPYSARQDPTAHDLPENRDRELAAATRSQHI